MEMNDEVLLALREGIFICAQHGGGRGDRLGLLGGGDPGRQTEQKQGKVEECTDDASGRKMAF
jgi:hypothetical protein